MPLKRAGLRLAVLLGQAVGVPAREQIRRYAWLGDTMTNWQPRPAETLQLMTEALGLLAGDLESIEAAMLYGVVAVCHFMLGDFEKFKAICFLAAHFIEKIPPCEELRVIYQLVDFAYLLEKDVATSLYWCERALSIPKQIHDLCWQGESASRLAYASMIAGLPLRTFLPVLEEGRRHLAHIGERKRVNWADFECIGYSLFYHERFDPEQLAAVMEEARTINPEHVGDMLAWLGMAYLSQGAGKSARVAVSEMLQRNQVADIHTADALVPLGYIDLMAGNSAAALEHFEAALALMGDPDFVMPMRKYNQ